jgi:DNA invertase Pin-like site-specific DNA recombinase
MQPTAIAYLRVSTKKQRDEKTIEAQDAWVRDAIKRDGAKLATSYGDGGFVVDDGVSGTLLEGRALSQTLADIEAGKLKVDRIYTVSLSRLSREDRVSRDPRKQIRSRVDAARIAATLGAYGVTIRDESGEVDPSSITYDIKAAMASQEHRDIRTRLVGGKQRKLKAGIDVMGGRPVYGYIRTREAPKGKGAIEGRVIGLALHEVEAERLRAVVAWYIQGGQTFAAKKAVAAGWPSPRGSATWHPSSVDQLLAQIDVYSGQRVRDLNGKRHVITYPPILDAATLAAVAKKKKERAPKQRAIALSSYYVDCECGAHANICTMRSGRNFVRCGKRPGSACWTQNEEEFSAALWNATLQRLIMIRDHERAKHGTKDRFSAQLTSARAKLQTAQQEIDKLLDVYLSNAIDKATFAAKNSTLMDRKNSALSDVERIEREERDHEARRVSEQSVEARVSAIIKECLPRGADVGAYRLTTKHVMLERQRQVLADVLQGGRIVVTRKRDGLRLKFPAFGALSAHEMTTG